MTPQELKCLTFVQAYQSASKGVSPSYEEIGAACGWASKSSTARVVDQLVRKGFMKKRSHGARSLEVIMGSPYSEIERAAIWWLLEAREGMTLPEIVRAVQTAYAKCDIDAGHPEEMTPDSVTLWLSACWENFGFHVGLEEVA